AGSPGAAVAGSAARLPSRRTHGHDRVVVWTLAGAPSRLGPAARVFAGSASLGRLVNAGHVTTVTVHHDHGAIIANHDINASYVPGAADIDASRAPSVAAYLSGLAGFLTAGTARTRRYLITRSYP